MKRKMIIAIAAAGLVLASVVAAVKASWISAEFALLDANAEALARGEFAGQLCYESITNVASQWVLYCGGSCLVVAGKPVEWSVTGVCK